MTELPSGTVTFLFTDLEVSTRLWDQEPDAMQAALARHDEILREAVDGLGGFVVKGRGDGVHAVFATAEAAVRAAIACELAMVAERWTVSDPLRARIGIHTGVAELRDGDYFGSAVNRAARLEAIAHGGQIVCSQATTELAQELVRDGVEFVDLGEHRLRDLSRPERVFQVGAPGLAADFAPIRSLNVFPGNLPVQLSSFVGRQDELVQLAGVLREARLVTVTGTGGVGKTRLAVQLAAELLQRFPDGAWLCELAAASDNASMTLVVAATLGVEPRAGVALDESIVEYLRNKQALVILDNCEHVLDGAARLADAVLRGCPNIRVVATSREGLGAEGERVWPLRSLPLTADARDGSGPADAPRLFFERAQAALPDLVLDAADAASIDEICRRLDGIPLAIELAAARVVSMGLVQIASHLDERFRLLTGGRRTAVERHQTLRATVDWSYSMLAPREQTVFSRLGVFSGSYDDSAAEAIVSGDGIEAWDVIDALGDLVAKSLVNAERSTGATRYQMLETMRAYAREQLDATDDSDLWRRRHAAYYAEFAEAAGKGLRGVDEVAWRRRLAVELDNLRAAVVWGVDAVSDADAELALRIVANLAWESLFDRASGIGAWAHQAIGRTPAAAVGLRVAVLGAAAGHATFGGDYDGARPLALAATEEMTAPGCPTPLLPLATLCTIEAALGRPDESLRLTVDAQRTFADTDIWSRGQLCRTCAIWAASSGDEALALAQAEEALRLARLCGNPSGLAATLYVVGWVMMVVDDGAAERALTESVELARRGASAVAFDAALSRLGAIRARRGDRFGALDALRESVLTAVAVTNYVTLGATVCAAVITLATLGHHEAVAVLAGARTRGAAVAAVSARERAEEARATERARIELGNARADELMQHGASMSFDEVADYLLAVIDGLRGEIEDHGE